MALSEFETKKCEKAIARFMEKRRPPPEIREKVDLGYRITGQSIEMFEIRPVWNDWSKTMELPLAKSTYVKSRGIWKIYWQRRDLKWHRYDPDPEVKTVDDFLDIVDRDEYCCFFG